MIFRKRYKLEVDSVEENNKGEREKAKEKKTRGSKKKIRQLFCCLIEYGELFELFQEGIVVLIILCFFSGLGIVLDEPGKVLSVVDLLAEHLFAASGIMYQLVSFLCITLKLLSKKKIQAKDRQCWEI